MKECGIRVKRIIIDGIVKHVDYHRQDSELPVIILFRGNKFIRSGFDSDGNLVKSTPAESRIYSNALDGFEQDLFDLKGDELNKRYPNVSLHDANIEIIAGLYKFNGRYC